MAIRDVRNRCRCSKAVDDECGIAKHDRSSLLQDLFAGPEELALSSDGFDETLSVIEA